MNTVKNYSLTLLAILVTVSSAMAQAQQVEMADVLRRDGKIYTVVISLVLVLTGFVIFLVRVDRRVSRIGKEKDKSS